MFNEAAAVAVAGTLITDIMSCNSAFELLY
jgi:hypothetical protein